MVRLTARRSVPPGPLPAVRVLVKIPIDYRLNEN